MMIRFTLNGEHQLVTVSGSESLLTVLRERLGIAGSKGACEQGECGSCSVVVDDDLVCSCLVMAADIEGTEVTTIEALGTTEELHPVQQAFLDHGAVQCGFCTPGFVVAAAYQIENGGFASREDLKEKLAGNLCRCTGYGAIERALLDLEQT